VSSGTGDKVRGQAQETLGKAKEGLGQALGNERLEGEGQADQVQGNITQAKGTIKDTLKDVGKQIGRIGKKRHR
jgi:uncharacterized protein YjbJ (UPF0337 family)